MPKQQQQKKNQERIAWVRKISEEGNDNLFQYSCLENSMDRGA